MFSFSQGPDTRQERLYFFQFPAPFPAFFPVHQTEPRHSAELDQMAVDTPVGTPIRRVSFAADVKPPAPLPSPTLYSQTPSANAPGTGAVTKEDESKVDGVIGQLQVYRSGAVKMLLSNGIVLDVRPQSQSPVDLLSLTSSFCTPRWSWQVVAATQSSFLQHAVHMDLPKKRLSLLGEVNKRFVVSPNIDVLLDAMGTSSHLPDDPALQGLIQMDM
jgi:DNA-directed RNA polymerase III subunit RPC4